MTVRRIAWTATAGILVLLFYVPLTRILAEGLRTESGWSLSTLRSLITDPYIVRVLVFTLKQAAWSTLLAVAIGLPGALLLARYRFPGRRVVHAMTVLPFVMPAVTVALGFVLFWGRSGAVNHLLMSWFGFSTPPVRVLYSMWGIVLAHAFYNAPVITRVVGAVWEGIDPELDEAAASLGRGPWRRAIGVTLPLLTPALVSGAALVFVLCFLSFPIVLALGGARYATVEVEIYTLIRTLLDPQRGAALILVETALSLGLAYLYLRSEAAIAVPSIGRRQAALRPLFAKPVSCSRVILLVYAALALVFFSGPIAAMIVDSLRRGAEGGWSATHYRFLLTAGYNPLLGVSPLGALGNSLVVATASTALAVPLGFAVSLFAVRSRAIGRRAMEVLLMAPLAMSSIAVGYAILRGLGGIVHGLGWWAALAIAHGILHYPFVARVLRPAVEAMDSEQVDAARALGARALKRLWTIELPSVWRGLVAATVFAFALSMGEMSAAIVLLRPGSATLPLAIHSLLAARQFGAASAMAVVLIGVTAMCFIAMEWMGTALQGWRWER